MAVEFIKDAGVQRTSHGYSVLPQNLVIDPQLSGRSEATDVTDLAADIEVNNQLENAVCWKNEQGWPVLAAGHRRYRAVALINERNKSNPDFEPRRLLFSYIAAKTDQAAFDYTIRENRNRVNPSPIDDAHNMHVYRTRFGLDEEAIARKYYPSILGADDLAKAVAEIKTTLKLLELSDDAKEALRTGKMSTTAAVQLASVPSRKIQDDIVADAKTKGKKIKVKDVKAAKAIASGKTVTNISQNTPVKQLDKFKRFAELAGALAGECMAKEFGMNPDKELIAEYSSQILVMCARLNITLQSSSDKWAQKHLNMETVLDKVAA